MLEVDVIGAGLPRDAGGPAGTGRLSPQELVARLGRTTEIAVLDVRDAGSHHGHVLRSVNLRLGQLEMAAPRLLPRRSVPVVVYDQDDGAVARQAADRLVALGYRDVSILTGGLDGWAAAGLEVYTGNNAIGKAFGELVEIAEDTPHLTADDLARRLAEGQNIKVLDCRTEPEFANFCIPGATNLPGVELAYRFHDHVPDPETLVVVHCAGRTRSIIGAQTLINAGVPNPVASLSGGTMEWLMHGFDLQAGQPVTPAQPSGEGLEQRARAARSLADRMDLQRIRRADLAQFQADCAADRRSLSLIDVRTQAEYLAAHTPGATWMAGGQLVQNFGTVAPVQGGRIVLADSPDLVRATLTAAWLKQINWAEVFILEDALSGPIETGPAPRLLAALPPAVATVSPGDLQSELAGGSVTVFDVDDSDTYRAGHLPGARFVLRSQLARHLRDLSGPLVLTSSDGILAAFVRADLPAGADVRVLDGGTAGWQAAGLPLDTETAEGSDPFEDIWPSPYQAEDRFAAFRDYLDWELELVAQVARDGTARFETGTGAAATAALKVKERNE